MAIKFFSGAYLARHLRKVDNDEGNNYVVHMCKAAREKMRHDVSRVEKDKGLD